MSVTVRAVLHKIRRTGKKFSFIIRRFFHRYGLYRLVALQNHFGENIQPHWAHCFYECKLASCLPGK